MKKLTAILTAILLVASMLTVFSSADPAEPKVIYINGTTGSDNNTGTSTADPVASLLQAFILLGDEGGIVCISGDTVVDDPTVTIDARTVTGWQLDMPEHREKIYITSINGAKLIKDYSESGTCLAFNGPVEIYNVAFVNNQNQNWNFYAYGNKLTFGNGITYTYTGTGDHTKGIQIFGFTANNEGKAGLTSDTEINVYSGTARLITGAGTSTAGTLTGNVLINVFGGTVATINGGGAGGHSGNTQINIYSGATVTTVTDTTTTGTKSLSLYNFAAGATTPAADGFTITTGTETATLPDSDFIGFTVNNVAPTTEAPTEEVTAAPTESQTEAPTQAPTEALTETPTEAPTEAPTQTPTEEPTQTAAPGSSDSGSGCKSMIASAGILAALICAGAVLTSKKRK